MTPGFFLIYRKLWENKLLKDEKFSEREAWAWMIGAANYEDKTATIGKNEVFIKRGEFITSIRKLAKTFKWSEKKVRYFLEKLEEKGAQIRAQFRAQSWTQITICNYESYQNLGHNSGHSSGHSLGQQLKKSKESNEVLCIFNKHCVSLKKAQKLTPNRIRAIKAHRKEYPDLEFWENLFKRVEDSDFLTGKVPGRNGDSPFRATFDWILKPANFIKIIEGNYDNHNSSKPKQKARQLTDEEREKELYESN